MRSGRPDRQGVGDREGRRWRGRDTVALLLVAVLAALACLWLARLVEARASFPFDTDEAVHALAAHTLSADLARHDWAAFARDLYAQATYPPLGAVGEALFFLLFGVSTLTARLFSVACLGVSALLLVPLGRELDAERGWAVGLVAAVLLLTAQPLLVLSSLSMLEVPGLAVSLLALWVYLASVRRPSRALELLAGLAVVAVALTKYQYGLVVLATVVTAEAVAAVRGGRRPARWARLAAAVVVPLACWFAEPWKLKALVRYATSQPHRVALLSLENLLYYPRALATQYLSSLVLAALGAAAVLWALLRLGDAARRTLLLYLAAGVAILVLKTQNEVRFVATVVPALYLLMGAAAVELWPRGSRRRSARWRRAGAAAVCLLAAVAVAVPAYSRLRRLGERLEVAYETDPQLLEAERWALAQAGREPLCVVDPWDQLSVQALWWNAVSGSSGGEADHVPARIATVPLAEGPSRASLHRLTSALGRSRRLVVLEREGSRWPEYLPWVAGGLAPAGERVFAYRQGADRSGRRVTVRAYRVTGPRTSSWPIVFPGAGGRCEQWPVPRAAWLAGGAPEATGGRLRMELDRRKGGSGLGGGWAAPERTGKGTTFAWIVGCEAQVALRLGPPRDRLLSLRLWPYHGLGSGQRIRGVLNGHVLGALELERGPQTLAIEVPAGAWREGENRLVLQLARALAPAEVNPESHDARPLAAAVDWIEVTPRPPVKGS